MSGFSVLHDISRDLKQKIFDALKDSPDIDLSLTDADTDVIIAKPESAESDGGKISLYLYHVNINEHMRNQNLVPINQDGLIKPPLPVNLKFLITPVVDDEVDNQLILGRLIQYFYDNPMIQSSGDLDLNQDRGGTRELRIHPVSLTIESLNQIWTAMNEKFRLSYVISVEVVSIDSGIQPAAAHRVGVSQVDLKQGVND